MYIYFRETCNLVGQMQELNTTEHFTKFYEEMFPFVQTLPLVISQKEIVFSKLVSGLHMEARLSLGAFLEYAIFPHSYL